MEGWQGAWVGPFSCCCPLSHLVLGGPSRSQLYDPKPAQEARERIEGPGDMYGWTAMLLGRGDHH